MGTMLTLCIIFYHDDYFYNLDMDAITERRVTIYGGILPPRKEGHIDIHVNILIKSKHTMKLVNNLESRSFL